jgi:hypothetical protein
MRTVRASISLAIAAAIALTSAAASAVPSELSFAGRLSTSAGPVDGTVSIRFAIFDVATGGAAVWSEDHPTIAADAGLVLAQLGTATTLDSTVFDGGRRWLEITVGSETLAPRLALGTVPYAFHAATADTLGDLAPGDVQARVTGTCPAGSAIRAIDPLGNATCEPDDDTTYTATAPLAIAGTTVSISPCASGQILKSNGASWGCAADTDTNTTYAASGPLTLSGTTFGLTSCPAGELLKSAGSTWTCGSDNDTNTTYVGSGPIVVGGGLIGLTACPSGFFLSYAGGSWTCTAMTGIAPITFSGGTVALQTAGCSSGQVYKLIGGMWTCANDNDTDTNTTYSAGAGLGLAGTTFSVDSAVVARKDSTAGSQSFDGGTLYLDYAANAVGIGTTTPTTSLDVTGVVRASSYRFAAEKPNTYVISDVEFQPYDLTAPAPAVKTFDSLILSGTSAPVTATLFAPIHLPPGAGTVDVACDLFDASSNALSYVIQVMHRIQTNTVAAVMASQVGSTTGSSTSMQTAFIVWSTAIAPEDTYYLSVQLTQPVTADANLRFYGCRVHYASLTPAY